MFVRLFVCLVFIMKIAVSDSHTHSKHEHSSRYIEYNHRNMRKLVTESVGNSAGGAAETTNKTGNNITVVPLINDKDKNGTVTKKPVDKEGMVAQTTQFGNLYPPYISYYEVTENVIDIPDDRTPAGPIDVNYTPIAPILNLAKPTNKTEIDKTTEANKGTTKKSWLTILHINAGYDEKEPVEHDNKVVGIFKRIKGFIKSFKNGIVNGVHSFFHKHQNDREIEEEIERAVMSKMIEEDCS